MPLPVVKVTQAQDGAHGMCRYPNQPTEEACSRALVPSPGRSVTQRDVFT